MSKYFPFLRKKRNPSLAEDGEEFVVPTSPLKTKRHKKRLRHHHHDHSKDNPSDQRLSLQNIGYYEAECDVKSSTDLNSAHSDNDSLLDSLSYGEVCSEGDSNHWEKTEHLTDESRPSSSGSYLRDSDSVTLNDEDKLSKNDQDEDEGLVRDGAEDDETSSNVVDIEELALPANHTDESGLHLIDDLMDEAFDDLEKNEDKPIENEGKGEDGSNQNESKDENGSNQNKKNEDETDKTEDPKIHFKESQPSELNLSVSNETAFAEGKLEALQSTEMSDEAINEALPNDHPSGTTEKLGMLADDTEDETFASVKERSFLVSSDLVDSEVRIPAAENRYQLPVVVALNTVSENLASDYCDERQVEPLDKSYACIERDQVTDLPSDLYSCDEKAQCEREKNNLVHESNTDDRPVDPTSVKRFSPVIHSCVSPDDRQSTHGVDTLQQDLCCSMGDIIENELFSNDTAGSGVNYLVLATELSNCGEHPSAEMHIPTDINDVYCRNENVIDTNTDQLEIVTENESLSDRENGILNEAAEVVTCNCDSEDNVVSEASESVYVSLETENQILKIPIDNSKPGREMLNVAAALGDNDNRNDGGLISVSTGSEIDDDFDSAKEDLSDDDDDDKSKTLLIDGKVVHQQEESHCLSSKETRHQPESLPSIDDRTGINLVMLDSELGSKLIIDSNIADVLAVNKTPDIDNMNNDMPVQCGTVDSNVETVIVSSEAVESGISPKETGSDCNILGSDKSLVFVGHKSCTVITQERENDDTNMSASLASPNMPENVISNSYDNVPVSSDSSQSDDSAGCVNDPDVLRKMNSSENENVFSHDNLPKEKVVSVERSSTHVNEVPLGPVSPEIRKHSLSEENFFFRVVHSDHKEAEARLAQRRAARAEARELRLRELEKQQQQEQEDEDEEQYAANSCASADKKLQNATGSPRQNSFFTKPTTRPSSSSRTSAGRVSLVNSTISGGQYSRRSSEDSTPDDALPSSARELKVELKELEEKFRKAMITNAQLDNEKATLTYEVDFLKDKYSELDESHVQLTKEYKKKYSENEQLRKLTNQLKEEVKAVRRVLQERDALIQEYGLVLIGEENGEEIGNEYEAEMDDDTINDLSPRKIGVKKALLSQEASDLLAKGAARGSLDVRLRKYAEDKNDLEDEVRRLRLELEEHLNMKRKENGIDYEKQKEASKSINEYKFRVQKAEAEVATLQANVARLESLVTRYKTSTEELEKSEEELKSEKRRLQRELRDALNRLEELELTNSHLLKRFDKLKTARSTLLKDLSQDPA